MKTKDKSLKRKIINAFDRVTDYLWINYLISWVKFRKYPNALFIKIPKTAGTSVLSRLPAPKLKKLRFIKYRFIQKGVVTFGHMSYLDIRKEGLVTDDFHNTAFKFAFVRNPYDRMVSLYHYLMQLGRYDKSTSFLDFCRLIDSRDIEPIGLYSVRGFSQCNPQVTWTNGIDMDFIGRFERLEEDFAYIAGKIGIKSEVLPHLRKSKRKSYADYYCPESAEIVRRIYREDFERFAYDPDEITFPQ